MIHRPQSNRLDFCLGVKIPILDHGWLTVVDYMGTDQSIVDAARVSYGDGTKKVRKNEGLIHYLMRNRHTSPFEVCEIRFLIRMPIFVARQWLRHRTANVNEESGRYSILGGECYVPELDRIKMQSTTNKQGSGDTLPAKDAEVIRAWMVADAKNAVGKYRSDIDAGVARELARTVLPLSTYTTISWKIDLHNLLHFLKLRTDEHAQWEIRQYAEAIEGIVEQWVPITYAAWRKWVRDAITISREEYEALKAEKA